MEPCSPDPEDDQTWAAPSGNFLPKAWNFAKLNWSELSNELSNVPETLQIPKCRKKN